MQTTLLMHMADGLISVPVGIIFFIISAALLVYSCKKIGDFKDEKKIPMMAVMGAFVFVAQMINFTIPLTGSSGHIGGGILLCLILGEYPAFLSICSVLIIQCFFFGDGGILALGCNMFNMGVIPCFIAYRFIVKPILKNKIDPAHMIGASMAGVIVGLELGAFAVVLQTLISGITALPFGTFVSLMLPIHLAIAIGEGIVTSLVVIFVYKNNPEMIDHALTNQKFEGIQYKKLLGSLLVLVVLVGGGLSLVASGYPDGLEWSIGGITGDTEIESDDATKEALDAVQQTTAFLPDYNFKGSESNLGVSTSGIVGGALTLFVIAGVGYAVSKKHG